MKTEISLIFGFNDKPRQTSPPAREHGRSVNPLEAAKYPKKEYRTSISNRMIDIESFSDLNLVFEVCDEFRT
jgi:hypothetical protein